MLCVILNVTFVFFSKLNLSDVYFIHSFKELAVGGVPFFLLYLRLLLFLIRYWKKTNHRIQL